MFLPRPYPDEVIGGILSRGYHRTGLSWTRYVHLLTRRSVSSVPYLMPFALDRFAESTGLSEEKLLEEHTLFPYATAFMSPPRRAMFKYRALRPGGVSGLDMLAKPILNGLTVKRICPECIDADTRRFGETYWHRSHLLPGVSYCAIHGTRLVPTTLSIQNARFVGDSLLPAEAPVAGGQLPATDPEIMKSFAYFSLVALSSTEGTVSWFSRYLASCAALGYGLRRRAVAAKVIAEDLQRTLGRQLLETVGAEIDLEAKSPWPTLLVRPTYATRVATIKHVLMQTFLFHAVSVGDLSHANYKRPGPAMRDYSVVDAQALERMRRFLEFKQEFGTKVTVRALVLASGEQPCIKRFGHRFPRSREFIRQFRYSPMALRRKYPP